MRNTKLMWIIVGATTIISPITLAGAKVAECANAEEVAMDERAAKAPA